MHMFVKSCSGRPLYTLQMNQQGTSHHQYRKFQNGIPLLANCLKKPDCFSHVKLCPIGSIITAWPGPVTFGVISPVLFGITSMGKQLLIQNTTTNSVVKPEQLIQGEFHCKSHTYQPRSHNGPFSSSDCTAAAGIGRCSPADTWVKSLTLQPCSTAIRIPYLPWDSQALFTGCTADCTPSSLSPVLRTVSHSLEKTTPENKSPLSTFTLDKRYSNTHSSSVCTQVYFFIKKSVYTSTHYKT